MREGEGLEGDFGVQVSGLIFLEFRPDPLHVCAAQPKGVRSVKHTQGLTIHSGNFIRGTIQGQTWQHSRDEVIESVGGG